MTTPDPVPAAPVARPGSGRILYIARVGILSAAAIVLMFLEFPLPLMPTFLKFDFSEIPILLGAFALGPVAALLMELIKNLFHLLSTQTGGVGELANFIVGASLTVTAGILYRLHRTRAMAYVAMGVGTLVMAGMAALMNYLVILPFYEQFMPLQAIIDLTRSVGNTLVTDMGTLILFVFVPFNLF